MDYLTAGIIGGTALYIGKMGTVYLIKQMLPFLKSFFHTIPGLLITDLGIGFLGTKTLTSMGASGLTSVFIMITFGFWTFLYIFSVLGIKKAKVLIGGI